MTAINAAQTTVYAAPVPVPVQTASTKSRAVAAILHLFLGQFGAGDFYLGRWATAIIRMVTGIASTVFLFVGAFGVAAGQNAADATAEGLGMGVMLAGFALVAVWTIWFIVTFIQILARKGGYATDRGGLPLS